MTTINDLAPYLTDFEYYGDRWRYEFPNGRVVSVIPDPRQPFRFEARVDRGGGGGEPVRGLTSEQVEAKLVDAYALPTVEPTVALVTVDDSGLILDDSTVTIGEFTWPVPHRSPTGSRIATARIATALREHGYRPVAGVVSVPVDRSGFIGVRVEPIETNASNDETQEGRR